MFRGKGFGIVATNLVFFGCALGFAIVGLTIVDNTGHHSIDASLDTVHVKFGLTMNEAFGGANPHDGASKTAYDKIVARTTSGTSDVAVADDLQAVLTQRMKTDYQLLSKSVGFLDSSGDSTAFPSDNIDFRYSKINNNVQMCSAEDIHSYADGLSPGYPESDKENNAADLGARCDEILSGDDIKVESASDCANTWIARLYTSTEFDETDARYYKGAFGIAVDDNHITEACKWAQDNRGHMQGMLISFLVLQGLSYAYWAFIQYSVDTEGNGADSDTISMYTRIAALFQLVAWALAITLLIFFGMAYSKTIDDVNNGLQSTTTVTITDDTNLADFPAQAAMYQEAFKLCFPGNTKTESATTVGGGGFTVTGNGCMTAANFKTAMEDLGLAGASECAFGSDKDTYSNPIDACNLPDTFENYKGKAFSKGGAEFKIKDDRPKRPSGDINLPIVSFDADPQPLYFAVFILVIIFIIKSTLVVMELTGVGPVVMKAVCCCLNDDTRTAWFGDDQKFAIAGGYAGAV